MTSLCVILTVLSVAVGGEELLVNPSFENVDGGKAVGWNLFVQPEPGAEGRVDDTRAFDGTFSVMLRNPDTYKSDPANNWSQNVLAPLKGKKLAVGGHIKTENAGGAAVWLQCWQRDPWRLVHVESTADLTPVTGTKDWTPVVMEVTVPEETDFIVLRCVLKGAGAAWFDGMTVRDAEAFQQLPAAPTPAGKAAPIANDGPLDSEASARALAEIRSLSETVRALKASNAEMSKDLESLREELRTLRSQLMRSRGPVFPDLVGDPGEKATESMKHYTVPEVPPVPPPTPRKQPVTKRGGTP